MMATLPMEMDATVHARLKQAGHAPVLFLPALQSAEMELLLLESNVMMRIPNLEMGVTAIAR
jgi:hypothetical protein